MVVYNLKEAETCPNFRTNLFPPPWRRLGKSIGPSSANYSKWMTAIRWKSCDGGVVPLLDIRLLLRILYRASQNKRTDVGRTLVRTSENLVTCDSYLFLNGSADGRAVWPGSVEQEPDLS